MLSSDVKKERELVENGLIAHSIIYFSIASITKLCTDIVLAQEDKAAMKRGEYITVKEV